MKSFHLLIRIDGELNPPYCGRAIGDNGITVEHRGKYADYSDVTGVTCKWCLKRMGLRNLSTKAKDAERAIIEAETVERIARWICDDVVAGRISDGDDALHAAVAGIRAGAWRAAGKERT